MFVGPKEVQGMQVQTTETDVVFVAEVDGLKGLPDDTLQLSLGNPKEHRTQKEKGCCQDIRTLEDQWKAIRLRFYSLFSKDMHGNK